MKKNLIVKKLNITHLPAVMGLQDKIIANLHPDEQHFILKRSCEDFIKALDSENTHMIGIFDGERLVAQSIFEFPKNGAKREYAEFAGDKENEELVVYKATLIDVEYRGQGLMQDLLNYRERKAIEAGKKTAISQIAIDNPASWINALKNGMSIRKVDEDPADGAKVLYMQKDFEASESSISADTEAFKMYIGEDIHREISALFNKMRYFALKGYCGIGIDRRTNSIVWAKRGESLQQDAVAGRLSPATRLSASPSKTIRS